MLRSWRIWLVAPPFEMAVGLLVLGAITILVWRQLRARSRRRYYRRRERQRRAYWGWE